MSQAINAHQSFFKLLCSYNALLSLLLLILLSFNQDKASYVDLNANDYDYDNSANNSVVVVDYKEDSPIKCI